MRDDRENNAELGELLGALRDGTISNEQMERLDRLLAADAGAREYYLEYMNLCALLGHFQGTVPQGPGLPPRRSVKPRRWLLAAAAAAALLGLGLSMFYVARQVEPARSEESKAAKAAAQVVAVLTCAVQPEWEGAAPAIGSELRTKERLRLRSGIVQLEFFSGVILVIEGPADFELRGTGRLCCREGRLRARVSPPAEGFTIDSSAVTLVDRGTEFGFRIDRTGRAEVHVFDGKVEMHDAADNTLDVDSPHLTSGNGVSIDPGGAFHKIDADPTAFVSAAKLKQQWHEELQRRHQRWLTHSQKLRADSRLLLYYTFQDQQFWERTLRNRAIVHESDLNGAIIGCEWSEGRWPGKGALDFKRPSDRVRLHVPGTYESLTYLAWARVDSIDQRLNALMLTDGFDEGAPHWQLVNEGRLRLGIQGRRPGGGYDYDSPAFLGLDRLGEWLQLATVYDHRSRTVTHYVDGRSVSREGLRFDIALRIGNVEIGNWGRINDDPPPLNVRNFNGRIDEFALFREALSAEEIARLYESGKACP
jgi:ferric-dicitrate binding protein FerR (iron transport regulator)